MASILLDPNELLPARSPRRTRMQETPTPVLGLPVRTPYIGVNRRFLPRVRRAFTVEAQGGSTPQEGIDISFGGMMCRAEEAVWPGNLVDLELRIGGATHVIPVVGRVVELVNWRGQLAMRVRFEQIAPEDRRRLAVWMAGQ